MPQLGHGIGADDQQRIQFARGGKHLFQRLAWRRGKTGIFGKRAGDVTGT